MTDIDCNVEQCKYNREGECKAGSVTICEENCMTVDYKKVLVKEEKK